MLLYFTRHENNEKNVTDGLQHIALLIVFIAKQKD